MDQIFSLGASSPYECTNILVNLENVSTKQVRTGNYNIAYFNSHSTLSNKIPLGHAKKHPASVKKSAVKKMKSLPIQKKKNVLIKSDKMKPKKKSLDRSSTKKRPVVIIPKKDYKKKQVAK